MTLNGYLLLLDGLTEMDRQRWTKIDKFGQQLLTN